MRGSAAFRTGVAPGGALAPGWVKNELWRKARAVPSLDLRFAENKSLVDATTGAQLVTFTRASSGTYVDSTGVLRTATTNFATFSQTLNNPAWVLSGTGATVTATADIAAPDGTMTAWTLTCGAGGFAQTQQVYIGISGVSYTGSFWIRRRSGTGTVAIRVSENTNTTLAGVTSDWQRFSFTATSTTTTIRLGIHLSGTSDAVDIWGAQLEQASTVGDYIPTTSTINSAPRFDHNPTTGESLGLLVEESRTNLQARSEEFDNTGTWLRTGLSTVTANTAVAPNGSTTADALVEDASTGNHRVFSTTSSLAASTSYSLSVYVKASTRTVVRVEARDSVGAFVVQDFNLTTQAITSAGSGTGAISALGNGWFRCTVTGTTSVSGGIGVVLIYSMQVVGNATYAGTNGTSAILLWGAQLEAGAFPTSYIPTTTAAATRSADVASISGSNFSSWYNQPEGALFIDAASSQSTAAANVGVVINDGTLNNRIELDVRAGSLGGAGRATVVSGGSASFDTGNLASPAFSVNTSYRQASSYKLDNFAYALNGGFTQTDTSGAAPVAPDRAELGARLVTALPLNGTIKRLSYWKAALPVSTLQTITQ